MLIRRRHSYSNKILEKDLVVVIMGLQTTSICGCNPMSSLFHQRMANFLKTLSKTSDLKIYMLKFTDPLSNPKEITANGNFRQPIHDPNLQGISKHGFYTSQGSCSSATLPFVWCFNFWWRCQNIFVFQAILVEIPVISKVV